MSDYTGFFLIGLAIVLFIAEIFTLATVGLLAAVGIFSLILGLSVLYGEILIINPWLITALVILVIGYASLAITKSVAVHHSKATTGREELIGKTGVVKVALAPEGLVFLKGELWSAVSESGRIEPGELVTINRVDGLKLHINKKG